MIDFLIQNFESNCHYLVKKSLGHFYEILLSLSVYLKATITEKNVKFSYNKRIIYQISQIT